MNCFFCQKMCEKPDMFGGRVYHVQAIDKDTYICLHHPFHVFHRKTKSSQYYCVYFRFFLNQQKYKVCLYPNELRTVLYKLTGEARKIVKFNSLAKITPENYSTKIPTILTFL